MGWVYISSVKKAKSLDSTVTSTSVEVKSYISDEGNTMYSPVYTYEVNGKTYKCESTSSSSIYPSNDNKYRCAFIHTRMQAYKKLGLKVDLAVVNENYINTTSITKFENIKEYICTE